MKELGRFDVDLQMFVEKPREANMQHLTFLRKLAEKGTFGPKPLSVPRGDNVFRMSLGDINKYAMQQADQELKPDQKMRQHLAANGDY